MMRPRRTLVLVHRWLSLALLAWVVIVSLSGAYLVMHDGIEAVLHPGRYQSTEGDVGPQAAADAAATAMPADALVYGLTLPGNGRGVYQVYAEVPAPEGSLAEPSYLTAYVDPGTGSVNEVRDEEEGISWWIYRGHMYLWQDYGPFGVFDPDHGACRLDADGDEPGGAKGVVCDVLPAGDDIVAWFAVGFMAVLLSGFYLWYWPGVKRWANAVRVRRGRGAFTFQLSLHKATGFVVWIPLLVVTFTGAAFAFPKMNEWFDALTPARADFLLWTPPEDAVSGEPAGRAQLDLDAALHTLQSRYPEREVHYIGMPHDETSPFDAWLTRGFDPWTREGGAGNTYVLIDQYSGATVYDGTPEDGNVFDQAWDDWSFPLHTGDFGGTLTRVVWVLLGLSPLVLAVTGATMYVIRLRKRAKRRRRPDDAPDSTGEGTPRRFGTDVNLGGNNV
jgi:uncharacterized iron-regulated membrane protein